MKKTYWLLQSNQVTPIIIEFLKTVQARIEKQLELVFIIPETCPDVIESAKILNPVVFKVSTRTATRSYQVYTAKKKALNGAAFEDGLLIEDTLLLDDLGSGSTRQAVLEIPYSEETCGLLMQVPTPLGSSESEEIVYQAAILWAAQNQIPSIGYEMLPMDTKWTLAPSLPDGIITKSKASFKHLTDKLSHNNIWLLPNHEAAIFSPMSYNFHLNGVRAAYHYKNHFQIPFDRSILYLPHNVALNYEYKGLLSDLKELGEKFHLMFSFGKDQSRGAYSHEETIKTVYADKMKNFASHSFHDANKPWEMMAADAVVSCSSCFQTLIARKELPCIVYDPNIPPGKDQHLLTTGRREDLLNFIKDIESSHHLTTELADILIMIKNSGALK